MFWVIADTGGSTDTALTPFLSTLISLGGVGLLLIGLLTGFLYTKGAYNEMKVDRDAWRLAYEKERDAHLASDEAAKMSLDLLQSMKGRQ